MSASRIALRVLQLSRTACTQTQQRIILAPYQPVRCLSRTCTKFETMKRFTQDHEWISIDTDSKIGTIGVTEYAQKALGDVVFVELPEVDADVSAGDSIGAVESVKSASDIMTPISGTIIETNTALDKKPSLINASAEGPDGWIAKLEVTEDGMAELESLMDEEAYKDFCTKDH